MTLCIDPASRKLYGRIARGERQPFCVTDAGRFMAHVKKDERGCWLWTGRLNNHGYPVFTRWRHSQKHIYAHRYSYTVSKGPIPEGLDLDHLCRTPACVNPDHLEPVTQLENVRRGDAAPKAQCVRGHPFSDENVYIRRDTGSRVCRACSKIRAARRRTGRPPGHAPLLYCCRGHRFDEANTHIVIQNGRPVQTCRACKREHQRRYAAARRLGRIEMSA